MRWLFHVARKTDVRFGPDERYRPPSFDREGFVHASFRDATAESARLYFPAGEDLAVLAIDPRRLDVPVAVVDTPRGPMPHVHGPIPRDAARVVSLDDVAAHADRVTGTKIALVAFEGMTLLDLVGPLDVLSRIASMGFDETASCEVIALTGPEAAGGVVWRGSGAAFVAERYRPALDAFDLVVVPGGPNTRSLVDDPSIAAYLATYPPNRMLASVCTGALLLGAAGRLAGRRATTHASELGRLPTYGAIVTNERVVEDRGVVTAGGVTAGIDLGLYLVRRLMGDAVADAIAARIEWRSA